jgi:hypothetical protein
LFEEIKGEHMLNWNFIQHGRRIVNSFEEVMNISWNGIFIQRERREILDLANEDFVYSEVLVGKMIFV